MRITTTLDKDHYAATDVIGIGTDLYDDQKRAELRIYVRDGVIAVRIEGTPRQLRRFLRNGLEGLRKLKSD